jgi:hypothetical protein
VSLRRQLRKIMPTWIADTFRLKRLQMRHGTQWCDPSVQTLLLQRYREMAARREVLADLNDAGFQVLSAGDEDGILLYLFGLFGAKNRTFVDIGAAGIEGSNTANLIISHGWYGLHIEMFPDALRFSQSFYKSRARSRIMPPKPVCAAITAENVNTIIETNGISGEIDFLSIDIDGNDYWVWKAVNVIQPRVVEMELQPSLGTLSKTVPYDPAFDRSKFSINQPPYDIVYSGASLAALVKLANEKGYTFVGCDSLRVNAFFVRNDVNNGLLPAADVESILDHPRVHGLVGRYKMQLEALPWVTI